MKKLLLCLTLLSLLAFGATAFAQDTPQTPDEACFAHNGNLDENGKCIVQSDLSIKIDYPLELDETPALGNLVDQWINIQRNQFISDFSTGGSPSPAPWEMDISYQIYTGPNDIESVMLTDYNYTGGAHGGNVLQTYVIDLSTGKLLKLTDLFQPGADVLGTLQTISRASINQQLGEGADQDWINQGTENLDAFQHFVLDGTTLLITFDQYQVGPYAIGNIPVAIPFSQISDILSPDLVS